MHAPWHSCQNRLAAQGLLAWEAFAGEGPVQLTPRMDSALPGKAAPRGGTGAGQDLAWPVLVKPEVMNLKTCTCFLRALWRPDLPLS